MSQIEIFKHPENIKIPKQLNKEFIIKFINDCVDYFLIKTICISIVFTNDEQIKFLHKKYFKKNTITDVITLDWSESKNIDGEVYINLDQTKRQAKLYKQTFLQEVSRLVLHGFLHLIGYDDSTSKKQKIMLSQQELLILKFLK
ncbi:MAG: rRNA maturation RNase YbeY [Bacteroidetes bacterium]|nr:rRNA maturation RNase YbeY [Bacteroidota bacterium]